MKNLLKFSFCVCLCGSEHTPNCSCGRFFEQHPTTVEGVEGENLERILNQIRHGRCFCLHTGDPNNPPNTAAKLASKTLLHAAAASGYRSAEVVQYLLEKKCFINKVCLFGPFVLIQVRVCLTGWLLSLNSVLYLHMFSDS